MNTSSLLKPTWVLAALLTLPLGAAAAMAKADYQIAKSRIGTVYKADKAACASFTANAKDICVEQAKGKEKLARAELEYAYSGTPRDANKVLVVKAETVYALARERCDDLAGNAKEACVADAKATEAAALTEAKLGKQVNASTVDAAKDLTDARTKAAVQKCDKLTADAKADCVSAAQAGAGKN